MKNFLKLDIKAVVILALVALFLLDRCTTVFSGADKDIEVINVDGKNYELLKHTVDTQYVERVTEVEKYVPQYITKIEVDSVEIPIDADTLEIVREYFSTFAVNDTLKLKDGLGYIYLMDTITQNKITGRSFKAFVKERTITDTKIVKELPKTQVFAGLNMTLNQQDVFGSVGTGLTVKTKKDKLYQVGVGVTNNGSGNDLVPYLGVGMQWRIKFKK
jgi:hypothetical protein